MNERKYLGKSRSFGTRMRVYEADDGFDLEVNEQYDVVQRRLMFDDVVLVTLHRERGWAYLLITGVWAAMFLGLATLIFVLSDYDFWGASAFFAVLALPGLIPFVIRWISGVHVATIFGKRSQASVRFGLRKQRARTAYERICAAVADAHARRAGEAAPVDEIRDANVTSESAPAPPFESAS